MTIRRRLKLKTEDKKLRLDSELRHRVKVQAKRVRVEDKFEVRVKREGVEQE